MSNGVDAISPRHRLRTCLMMIPLQCLALLLTTCLPYVRLSSPLYCVNHRPCSVKLSSYTGASQRCSTWTHPPSSQTPFSPLNAAITAATLEGIDRATASSAGSQRSSDALSDDGCQGVLSTTCKTATAADARRRGSTEMKTV